MITVYQVVIDHKRPIPESLTDAIASRVYQVCVNNGQQIDVTVKLEEARCSKDPLAPHGFDRNASHNAGRYVCECEGWAP